MIAIGREELPRCNAEYESDPGETAVCKQPAISRWTFPGGETLYCCEEHDADIQETWRLVHGREG